jgi:hypothetical protein
MICGINPFTISSIRWYAFKRYGPHPLYTKVMRKKNPIRGWFGVYSGDIYGGYIRPTVEIRGSNGNVLKIIKCRSNDHAKQVCDDFNAQLTEWVKYKKGSN